MRHQSYPWVPTIMAALAICFGAVAIGGCESSPTQAYELSGVITDERTSAPIEGASVTFVSDTGYSAATSTNGSGEYAFGVETDHPFGQVRAEAEGYRPGEASVFFDAPSRRIDIALIPGRTSE